MAGTKGAAVVVVAVIFMVVVTYHHHEDHCRASSPSSPRHNVHFHHNLHHYLPFRPKQKRTKNIPTTAVAIRRMVDRQVSEMIILSCVSLTIFLGGNRL